MISNSAMQQYYCNLKKNGELPIVLYSDIFCEYWYLYSVYWSNLFQLKINSLIFQFFWREWKNITVDGIRVVEAQTAMKMLWGGCYGWNCRLIVEVHQCIERISTTIVEFTYWVLLVKTKVQFMVYMCISDIWEKRMIYI